MISTGARAVVLAVFFLLAAAFVLTTATLIMEFRSYDWLTFAVTNSHLFLFFPTFGILALISFFTPAAIFVDHYWRNVPFGRLRLVFGGLMFAAGSLAFASYISRGDTPAIWWVKPDVLAADRGAPAGCKPEAGACDRAPVMSALKKVREVSNERMGLSEFARSCKDDSGLLEPDTGDKQKRYCFASQKLMTALDCCAAQKRFAAELKQMYAGGREMSLTAKVHLYTLAPKVFFLLMLLAIGIMLAVWRPHIDEEYPDYAFRIERGVLLGALVMMLWPIMNHAFLQTTQLLLGPEHQGAYVTLSPVFSVIFGAWGLTILFYFYRQKERDVETAGKMVGALASLIAVMKYNQIIDYGERFLGAGADPYELAVIAIAVVFAYAILLSKAAGHERSAARRD